MSKPAATRNTLSDAEAALGRWISLHTGDPGTTGANEATGGSPAYARKQTTWGASAAGVATGSLVSIDVPAGTYSHFGVWSASTAGTFVDGAALSSTEVYAAQGVQEVTPTLTTPA